MLHQLLGHHLCLQDLGCWVSLLAMLCLLRTLRGALAGAQVVSLAELETQVGHFVPIDQAQKAMDCQTGGDQRFRGTPAESL